MTDVAVTRDNVPYIGPVAFREGQHLFGRERELLDLMDLTISERIVLLHSPSGAGKTSLLQAGFIPKMRDEGFVVFEKVFRLNQTAPEGTAGVNRYLYSLTAALEEGRPEGPRIPPGDLSAYIGRRLKPAGPDQAASPTPTQELWVFDQFEEVLTLDPNDREAKEEFFTQLGKALRQDKRVWAVFAMREDYLGLLSPLSPRIPTGLGNKLRLDLLGPESAVLAVRMPAEAVGVDFEEAAADKLVNNLRLVKGADGVETLGTHVEPVQLQVVCRWLWEKLADEADKGRRPRTVGRITEEDLSAIGDVDDALAGYYAARVAEAATPGAPERAIRSWFGSCLIDANSRRRPVPLADEAQTGLPLAAIETLKNAYLVREDRRGSFAWVELAHDRLVEPVKKSNAAWFTANLSRFQLRAMLWDSQGRPAKLLLSAPELVDGEAWARAHPDAMTDVERALIKVSGETLTGRGGVDYLVVKYQLYFAAGLASVLGVGFIVCAILLYRNWALLRETRSVASALAAKSTELSKQATVLKTVNGALEAKSAELSEQATVLKKVNGELKTSTALIEQQYNSAQDQFLNLLDARSREGRTAVRAQLSQLATRSLLFAPDQKDLSLLLGVEAVRRQMQAEGEAATEEGFEFAGSRSRVEAWSSLLNGLNTTPQLTFFVHPGSRPVKAVAIDPGGTRIASVHADGVIFIIESTSGRIASILTVPHEPEPSSAAFSPDGRRLAVGYADGTVVLRDPSGVTGSLVLRHDDEVDELAFINKGRALVTVSGDQANVWDLSADKPPPPRTFRTAEPSVALAVSPDDAWIATGGGMRVQLWNSSTLKAGPTIHLTSAVRALAFGPEKHVLAVAVGGGEPKGDGANAGKDRPNAPPPGRTPRAQSAPRPTAPLAGANAVLLFAADSGEPRGRPLTGHEGFVNGLSFSRDGKTLATAGDDKGVILWDVAQALRGEGEKAPLTAPDIRPLSQRLNGHKGPVSSVAFGPGGLLVSGGLDQLVILWDVTRRQRFAKELPPPARPYGYGTLAVNPAGDELAVSGWGQDINFWKLPKGSPFTRASVSPIGMEVNTLSYSPDGATFAANFFDLTSITRFWRTDTWSPVTKENRQPDDFRKFAFNYDGSQVVGIHNKDQFAGRGLTVFRLSDHGEQGSLPQPVSGYWDCLAVSPDGRTLAVSGLDRVIELARMGGGKIEPFAKLSGHAKSVTCLAFSPDGRTLASGGEDNAVFLWDVRRCALKSDPLTVHRGAVRALAFSPDGKTLATAGDDKAVVLVDGRVGLSLGPPLIAHDGAVTCLAFTPDGKALVSAGADGRVYLWDLDPASWQTMACSVANRNLTRSEWSDAFGDEEPYRKTCDSADERLLKVDALLVGWRASRLSLTDPRGKGLDLSLKSLTRVVAGPTTSPSGDLALKTGPALLLEKRWLPGQTLRLRFLDGAPEDRAAVQSILKEWTARANITFAASESRVAEVRVSFTGSGESRSVIGTDCLNVPDDKPTVTISADWKAMPRDAGLARFRHEVLHEFGHVLGFIHEHQKPGAHIAWDVARMRKDLVDTKKLTESALYETYFRRFKPEEVALNTALDLGSVMTAPADPKWTLDGTALTMHSALSPGDLKAVEAAYPPDPPAPVIPPPPAKPKR